MKRVYLDYAAAAPVLKEALSAFTSAITEYGNPSSPHEEGRGASALLREARTTLGQMLQVKADHIIFTSGATEANTLAIEGHVRALRMQGREAHLMYHAGAHSSVTRVMERMKAEGVSVDTLPLIAGSVDLAALTARSITLVSIEGISPETGMRHDLRALSLRLKELNPDTLLHVDASQMPRVESVERARLHADFLTLDAQKIGGVRGVGCLARSARAALSPIQVGGGQEGGLRSGTEPVALIAAFVAALLVCEKKRASYVHDAEKIRAVLISRIMRDIRDVVLLGGKEPAPHILSFALAGRDTDYLQALLDVDGFSVGTKSACESDSEEGSRMASLETGDETLARSMLRVSWGPETTGRDAERFVKSLVKNVSFIEGSGV